MFKSEREGKNEIIDFFRVNIQVVVGRSVQPKNNVRKLSELWKYI